MTPSHQLTDESVTSAKIPQQWTNFTTTAAEECVTITIQSDTLTEETLTRLDILIAHIK